MMPKRLDPAKWGMDRGAWFAHRSLPRGLDRSYACAVSDTAVGIEDIG